MRWPWSKRSGRDRDVRNQPAMPDPRGMEAQARAANAALGRADADYRSAVQREPEVEQVASSLRRLHNRNRFAEMMLEAFRGST